MEYIVLKHTIEVMPKDVKNGVTSNYQILKATGKATIISFIRYLKALNVDLFAAHDKDSAIAGAVKL